MLVCPRSETIGVFTHKPQPEMASDLLVQAWDLCQLALLIHVPTGLDGNPPNSCVRRLLHTFMKSIDICFKLLVQRKVLANTQ